jgi:hypothetical protein
MFFQPCGFDLQRRRGRGFAAFHEDHISRHELLLGFQIVPRTPVGVVNPVSLSTAASSS